MKSPINIPQGNPRGIRHFEFSIGQIHIPKAKNGVLMPHLSVVLGEQLFLAPEYTSQKWVMEKEKNSLLNTYFEIPLCPRHCLYMFGLATCLRFNRRPDLLNYRFLTHTYHVVKLDLDCTLLKSLILWLVLTSWLL